MLLSTYRNGTQLHLYLFTNALAQLHHRMNFVSLDTIGIAGFSHNFGALEGKYSAVAEAFDSFGGSPPSGLAIILPVLSPVLPLLMKIPTRRRRMFDHLHKSMEEIAEKLLERSRKEKEAGIIGESSRSIIGALSESRELC